MNLAEYYNKFSELYDVRNETTLFVSPVAVDRFVSELRTPSHILDAGCGPGREASYFHSHGHKISGIDLSPGMIERFHKRLPDAQALVGDVTSLPQFPAETFDAVFCGNVLLHLDADRGKAALKELARVIKRAGILFLATMIGDGTSDTYTHMSARELGLESIYFYYWKRDELLRVIEQLGFSVIFENQDKPYAHRPEIFSLVCRL